MSQRSKSKKKKLSFDFDDVRGEVEEQNKCFSDLREHLDALRNFDIKCLLNIDELKEDEALQVLACKLSVDSLQHLKVAIKHVPENILRTVDGVSLRLSYIFKIFMALATKDGASQPNLTFADVELYVKILECRCPRFLSEQDSTQGKFWKLTEKENMPFNKFLSPPVRTCLRCERTLTMKNYPAKVKLFTLNGPIPCAKITLECRSCCCVYGVCQYSEKSETHFYPAEMAIEMVQVSNVTYIDLQLYKWFPSLR